MLGDRVPKLIEKSIKPRLEHEISFGRMRWSAKGELVGRPALSAKETQQQESRDRRTVCQVVKLVRRRCLLKELERFLYGRMR